jgi:hypothetical protein
VCAAVGRGGVFDAFGHHGQIQVVGQLDGGRHDGLVAGALQQAAHKGLVYFQFIDRQVLHVRQR